MPFGEVGQAQQSVAHGVAHLARPQAGGQAPDRLDRRQPVGLRERQDVVRMRHGEPAVEFLQLAGDQQLRAGRHALGAVFGGFRVGGEEHQFGEGGVVLHHDAPGLARRRGGFVPHHLDFQGRDGAGLGLRDGRAGAAIHVGFGKVEQQVDHPLAAGRLGDQRRHRRDGALQCGQRREQRGEGVGLHDSGGGRR